MMMKLRADAGDGPFTNMECLITGLITKLLPEASREANQNHTSKRRRQRRSVTVSLREVMCRLLFVH